MSLQCDNLSGELQDQWSSSYHKSGAIWGCLFRGLVNMIEHTINPFHFRDDPNLGWSSDFHIYSLDWTAERIM